MKSIFPLVENGQRQCVKQVRQRVVNPQKESWRNSMIVAHTCYCFSCGDDVKESRARIRALENRVQELELQNRVLHTLTLNQEEAEIINE